MEYQIKFTACLLVFFLFYKWILEKESFHAFKRFYLLLSLLVASAIPLISIPDFGISNGPEAVVPALTQTLEFKTLHSPVKDPTYLIDTLVLIYLVGLVYMGCRYILNLRSIWLKINRNQSIRESLSTKILLEERVVPHTFLSYIFLNRIKYLNKEIPHEVILHEETHAVQRHSIDILIIELLQVIFWFNPLIYFLKKSIKLNHEFLADQAVLRKGVAKFQYWETLLSYNEQKHQTGIANAINYSSIKKRLHIMKKQTSVGSAFIRRLALVPLICLLLYGFGDRTPDIPVSVSDYEYFQEGASEEMVAEYNKLARKYNAPNQDLTKILNSELQRITYIHNLMSDAQRVNAEPFPRFATPPTPPSSPSVSMKTEVMEVAATAEKETRSPQPEIIEVSPSSPKGAKNAQPEVIEVAPSPKKVARNNHPDVIVIASSPDKADRNSMPEVIEVAPSGAKGRRGPQPEVINIPPPPPPAEDLSPAEFIAKMETKNAKFYYNGKSIDAARASKLVKQIKDLHIATKASHSDPPEVFISKKRN